MTTISPTMDVVYGALGGAANFRTLGIDDVIVD